MVTIGRSVPQPIGWVPGQTPPAQNEMNPLSSTRSITPNDGSGSGSDKAQEGVILSVEGTAPASGITMPVTLPLEIDGLVDQQNLTSEEPHPEGDPSTPTPNPNFDPSLTITEVESYQYT